MSSNVDSTPTQIARQTASNEDILENEFSVGNEEVTTEEALDTLEKLRRKTRNFISQHRIASLHFSSRQFNWFFMPQVILGLIASIISFLADSSLVVDIDKQGKVTTDGDIEIDIKSAMTTSVGIISLIIVAIQTVSREKQFGERGVMHTIASENFHHLEIELDNFLSLFSMENKEKKKREALENGKKVLLRYQRRFREVEVGCKSPIPIELANAFILLESNIESSVFKAIKKKYHQEPDEFHKFSTQTLCQEICAYTLYPLLLPRADMMVQQTTNRVISRLQEMDEQEVNFMKNTLGLEEKRTEQNILQLLRVVDDEQLEGLKGDPVALENVLRKISENRERQVNQSGSKKKRTVSQEMTKPWFVFNSLTESEEINYQSTQSGAQGISNTMPQIASEEREEEEEEYDEETGNIETN